MVVFILVYYLLVLVLSLCVLASCCCRCCPVSLLGIVLCFVGVVLGVVLCLDVVVLASCISWASSCVCILALLSWCCCLLHFVGVLCVCFVACVVLGVLRQEHVSDVGNGCWLGLQDLVL